MIYTSWVNRFKTCTFILFSMVICAQSDVPRPRGVSLSKAPLYSPTKDFTCFDGTISIPFSYVNDDYCDCFDGSDEPGTSACLNGVFHCMNAGYRPQNIPSSRVNDGVCDCCDGSDEYGEEKTCSNICEELGREARAEAQRLAELHKEGSHLRHELIEKGNIKRREMADQLAQLEKDKSEAEKIKFEKEALKSEFEELENEALKVYREAEEQERQKKAELEKEKEMAQASNVFASLDLDGDGIVTKEELKAEEKLDRDFDGEVDENDLKYLLGDNESVDKDEFLNKIWTIYKPLLSRPEMKHDDDTEDSNDEEGYEIPKDEPIDGDEELEEPEHHEEESDQEELPVENTVQYDAETQKIIAKATEARSQHTDAERTVREIEANIKRIQENLEKDYGLQQEYATLDGQCHELEDAEYIYKLCLFQKVTQKSRNGGGEVGLGNWGEWAHGQLNKYTVMKYTNGVGCWNGPSRMTTVNIQCGLETKILSVTEPFRCEYQMELSTPAACDDSNLDHSTHDEL